MLVKPEVALLQMAADAEAARQAQARARAAAEAAYSGQAANSSTVAERSSSAFVEPPTSTSFSSMPPVAPAPIGVEKPKTRFHGSIKLDPRQPSKQMPTIAAEVLQHLTSLLDCNVEITLEIHAENAAGFPEDIQRIIKENCATLKFEKETDFEEE